jgi:hypothetical protein
LVNDNEFECGVDGTKAFVDKSDLCNGSPKKGLPSQKGLNLVIYAIHDLEFDWLAEGFGGGR